MSDDRVSLDTNVLIYAFDRDAGNKQIAALELIEKCVLDYDCVLTTQTLSEFYFAATRKKIVPHDVAVNQINDWQTLFPTLLPSTHTIKYALAAIEQHNISFWDAMLWSVTNENGVVTLYSEDFQSTRKLGNVTFINPFQR